MTRATVRLAIDAVAVRVVDIENVEALMPATDERTTARVETIRARAARCAVRAVGIQERVFRQGIHRAEPLEPTLLDADAPGMAASLIAHADLEVFGERLPASVLFQKSVPLKRGGEKAEVALSISVLEVLAEDPFSSDGKLERVLTETYAGITIETVRTLRAHMGIEASVCRFDPASMMSLAIERVATTRWLRERMRSYLQVERKLGAVRVPWPAWWSATQLTGMLDGRVAYTLDKDLRFLDEDTFDIARGTWERFQDLVLPAQELALEQALATLLARVASRRSEKHERELSILMASAISMARFPEPINTEKPQLSGRDVLNMFALAPREEWSIVLERMGIEEQQVDALLVDALAEALSATPPASVATSSASASIQGSSP